MGRPSSFDQATADLICERLLEGESLTSICADPGVPTKPCILKWLRDFPYFQTQYALARALNTR